MPILTRAKAKAARRAYRNWQHISATGHAEARHSPRPLTETYWLNRGSARCNNFTRTEAQPLRRLVHDSERILDRPGVVVQGVDDVVVGSFSCLRLDDEAVLQGRHLLAGLRTKA